MQAPNFTRIHKQNLRKLPRFGKKALEHFGRDERTTQGALRKGPSMSPEQLQVFRQELAKQRRRSIWVTLITSALALALTVWLFVWMRS